MLPTLRFENYVYSINNGFMKTLTQIIFLFFILLSNYHPLLSQSMSVTSGVGITHYFDLIKDDHLRSEYGLGNTYFVKVDFNEGESTGLLNNLALKFEKQSADINYSSQNIFCGLGLPSDLIYTFEHINKYTLSVITYPLSIRMGNNLKIKSGLSFSKTFKLKATNIGEQRTFTDEIPFESQIENRDYNAHATIEFQFGHMLLGNGLSLIPTYNAFVSLTPELKGSYNTQSMRHSLGLTVLWGLKKK